MVVTCYKICNITQLYFAKTKETSSLSNSARSRKPQIHVLRKIVLIVFPEKMEIEVCSEVSEEIQSSFPKKVQEKKIIWYNGCLKQLEDFLDIDEFVTETESEKRLINCGLITAKVFAIVTIVLLILVSESNFVTKPKFYT